MRGIAVAEIGYEQIPGENEVVAGQNEEGLAEVVEKESAVANISAISIRPETEPEEKNTEFETEVEN